MTPSETILRTAAAMAGLEIHQTKFFITVDVPIGSNMIRMTSKSHVRPTVSVLLVGYSPYKSPSEAVWRYALEGFQKLQIIHLDEQKESW